MKPPNEKPDAPEPTGSTGAAAVPALAPGDAAPRSEADGWYPVARAAQLLGIAIPRIFDRIRDGKLQVRFEPTKSGEADRPLVTSPELRQKAGEKPAGNGSMPAWPTAPATPAAAAAPAAATAAAIPAATSFSVPAPAPPPARSAAEIAAQDELRRAHAHLQAEARELRDEWDAAEARLDTALKTIYERDVRIARLEAEAGAHAKVREEGDVFIRHLEARLDRTENRNEEKEKEIRRLAVGIGEAHSELRLLKPPPPEPPKAWKRVLARTVLLLGVAAGAGTVGWVAWQLGLKALPREAGIAAAAGALLAFAVGFFLERLRRSK
ncbi:MAG TPA: hypothetical protein VFG37_08380 [Planctomycetota bacterium]|nr:hypothetical protein [Planctomycetota bacterium]